MSMKERDKAATTPKHWVRLTRMCNNRCIFCLDRQAHNGTSIPWDEIGREIARGRKENKKKIILSGGEPTIHPRFLDIVALAKKNGFAYIQVISNGRMFAYMDFLDEGCRRGIKEITFSFHGHTEQLHDSQTRVKGSFLESLSGLANALQQPGLIVNVDVVVNKSNIKSLPDIIDFFVKKGVREFDLLQVIPFGAAWEHREKVFYSVEDNLSVLSRVFQMAETSGITIWLNRFPAAYLEGAEWLIQHPCKLHDEVYGRKQLFKKALRSNGKLDCYGQRCAYCVLRDFCRDLIALKSQKIIHAKMPPCCLTNLGYKKAVYRFTKDLDIFDFLRFFIAYRYSVKSSRCLLCSDNSRCEGAPIDDIRTRGFGILRPSTKEQDGQHRVYTGNQKM